MDESKGTRYWKSVFGLFIFGVLNSLIYSLFFYVGNYVLAGSPAKDQLVFLVPVVVGITGGFFIHYFCKNLSIGATILWFIFSVVLNLSTIDITMGIVRDNLREIIALDSEDFGAPIYQLFISIGYSIGLVIALVSSLIIRNTCKETGIS